MDKVITIPEDLFPESDCAIPAGRTAIRLYDSMLPSLKTRVTIHKNLFSFLLEGEKVVHRPGNPIRIGAGQFLLIAGGNCLMSEKLSLEGRYRSLLFFFEDELLREFFVKHAAIGVRVTGMQGVRVRNENSQIVSFDSDAFVGNYLRSLELMLTETPVLKTELQQLKLEELLLYLAGNYPEALASFSRMSPGTDGGDEQVRAAVEGNLDHQISVEELAFMCNMSLSTFKRRFGRLYGTTPNKWLLQRRMEKAAALLDGQEKPSEVYLKVGYENHSSFSQSFKQVYGMTPREYQQRRAGVTA
ncbi:MAG TPA: AraC family transcriptional regulator [Puia sp.]|nr:AraC family transcriptional regulator [Puia sp.]